MVMIKIYFLLTVTIHLVDKDYNLCTCDENKHSIY